MEKRVGGPSDERKKRNRKVANCEDGGTTVDK
jgi:hypothetical protein